MDLAEFFRPEKKKFVLPVILLIIFAVSAITFLNISNDFAVKQTEYFSQLYEFQKSQAIFLSKNGYDPEVAAEYQRRSDEFTKRAQGNIDFGILYYFIFSVTFDVVPCSEGQGPLCYSFYNKVLQQIALVQTKAVCVNAVLYDETGINSTLVYIYSRAEYPKPEVALTGADFAKCDSISQPSSYYASAVPPATKDFTLSMILAAVLLFALSYVVSCLILWSYRTRAHVRTHLIKYLIVLTFVFVSLSSLFFNLYFGPGILVSMILAIILAELGVWYVDRHRNYWKLEFFVIYAFFMPLVLSYPYRGGLYNILYLPFSLILAYNWSWIDWHIEPVVFWLASLLNAAFWLVLIHYIEKREAKIKHDNTESRLLARLSVRRRK